jgi:hypothetical protein
MGVMLDLICENLHMPRKCARAKFCLRLPRGGGRFMDSRMTSEKPELPELPQKDAAAAQSSGTVRMSGQALVDALAISPLRDVEFEPEPYYPPVRDVVLDW